MFLTYPVIANDHILINGKLLDCNNEVYNCPSYNGKYVNKRLKSCIDVETVWKNCKSDIHDLDRDKDGKPCDKDCLFSK
jgi:hypothetical protein